MVFCHTEKGLYLLALDLLPSPINRVRIKYGLLEKLTKLKYILKGVQKIVKNDGYSYLSTPDTKH
jgi:hypothetical protein